MDSIVRVEAGRLRGKLEEYYRNGGSADPVRISLARGRYAPTFAQHEVVVAPPLLPVRGRFSARIMIVAGLVIVGIGIALTWRNERAPTLPGKPVVAVLPLVPYGNDAAASILGEKLTEGITAELVREDRLAVVPSARATRFGDPHSIPDDIGAQLGAQYLLRGRVVPESAERLRVEIVMMDGALTRKPWGSTFTGSSANLDELEQRIAREAAEAIIRAAAIGRPESSSAR